MRRRKLPDRKMRKEERHPLVLFFNALAISSLLFRMAPISARLPCRVGATDAPLGSGQLTAWHLRVDSTRGGAADDDARANAARLRWRVLNSLPPGPPSARNNHEGIWSACTEVAGPRAAWAKAQVA